MTSRGAEHHDTKRPETELADPNKRFQHKLIPEEPSRWSPCTYGMKMVPAIVRLIWLEHV
jgi:hypothetical protein